MASPAPTPIDSAEFARVLAEHAVWLDSEGRDGRRANLQHRDLCRVHQQLRQVRLERAVIIHSDLRGALLEGADLAGADLSHSILSNAKLVAAKLVEANLAGARLDQADLSSANVSFASFRGASVRNTNLSAALGVSLECFAGADLTGAKLPECVSKGEGISRLEKEIESSSRLVWLLLSLSVFVTLTLVSTKHAQLVSNDSTLVLPSVSTPIRTTGFYWCGPLVLLSVLVYCQLNLHVIWRKCAHLPRVLPDGRPGSDAIPQWILTEIANCGCRWPKSGLEWCRTLVAVSANWLLIPVLIIGFWWSYLPRHDWIGTLIHLAIVPTTLVVTWAFARATIGANRSIMDENRPIARAPLRHFVMNGRFMAVGAGLLTVAMLGASYLAIGRGGPNTWRRTPWRTANLEHAVVGTLPNDWSGKDEQVMRAKGAPLQGFDLRFARASFAVLLKAELQNADLEEADFYGADLRHAKLNSARLDAARFAFAQLGSADFSSCIARRPIQFTNAQMDRAVFVRADFAKDSDLVGVTATQARFQNAVMIGANLNRAKFHKAHFDDAKLTGSQALNAEFDNAELIRTKLDEAKLNNASFRNANLRRTEFESAVLEGADFRGATCDGVNFTMAELDNAHFEGVDLQSSIGLTRDQIKKAHCDAMTRLPTNLP